MEPDTVTAPEVIVDTVTPPEVVLDTVTAHEVIVDTVTAPEVIVDTVTAPEVVVPDIVSILDVINDHATIVQRESDTKAFLTAELLTVSPSTFKPKLFEWATLKFPAIFPIVGFQIDVPDICADGVSRSLQAFIEYSLGMPLSDIITSLSAKLPGMEVSYSSSGMSFFIHVSKA